MIVQMPVGLNTKKQKVDPSATAEDMASDTLMKRLAELGPYLAYPLVSVCLRCLCFAG